MGDVIVTDAKTLPAASDNEILVVEQYPGIPKPTNRLANGIYYSFKKVWYNFSKYLVPNSRTITINGDTKDLSENRDWTVDAGAIDSVADTNTVDLTVDVNRQLTADVKYQNTSTVNLSEDALGLKADLATGAAVVNIGYTPEDVANKTDTMSGNTTSSTKYLSAKGVYDWVIGLGYQVALTAANFGSFINGLTGKTTPVDADSISIVDSADSNNAKKLSWANLKATLKTYFDTLYNPSQVLLQTVTANGDAYIGLTIPAAGTYTHYKIVISGLYPDGTVGARNIWIRFGTGSPVTYHSAVGDYQYSYSGSASSTSTSSSTIVLSATNIGYKFPATFNSEILLFDPYSARDIEMKFESTYRNASTNIYVIMGGGFMKGDLGYGAVTGVQILTNNGETLTAGTFKLYGLK